LRCPMSIERQNPSMISHHRARGYLTFPHSGFSRAIRQKLPQRTAHPSVFQQRKSFSYKRSLLLSRLPSPRKRIFDIPHSGFSRAIREKFSQMAAHPPVFQQRKSFSYKRSLLLSRLLSRLLLSRPRKSRDFAWPRIVPARNAVTSRSFGCGNPCWISARD
jgi:hypothetical protein